jgi:hypothetical protein
LVGAESFKEWMCHLPDNKLNTVPEHYLLLEKINYVDIQILQELKILQQAKHC